MQPIKNLADQVLTQPQQSQVRQAQTVAIQRTSVAEPDINRLFARMSAIYGHKFNSLFRDAKSLELGKREWASALAPLSAKQIDRGIEACRYLAEWNPSVPEFIRVACDLPNLRQCISRVINGENIDPVSYRVTEKIGSFSLQTFTLQEQKAAIANNYDDVYAKTLSEAMGDDDYWQSQSDQAEIENLQDEPEPVASDEVHERGFSELKSMLGR